MRSPALKIVMAVRDVQKGAQVREELSEVLGRELAHKSLPADVFKRRMGDAMNAISVEALDLCDMKSVNAFVSRMNSKSGKTSVLVNNAGAVTVSVRGRVRNEEKLKEGEKKRRAGK